MTHLKTAFVVSWVDGRESEVQAVFSTYEDARRWAEAQGWGPWVHSVTEYNVYIIDERTLDFPARTMTAEERDEWCVRDSKGN